MTFALILPGSRRLITESESPEARPADADRAAEQLRADMERWSRWGLGLLGFVLAVTGSFVAIGFGETVRMLGGTLAGIDLLIVVAASLVAAAGIVLLVLLWRTGRRLLTAAGRWLRLPYTRGGRRRRPAGWLRARTVNFEPRIFARITTSSLALLLAVGGISLFVRDLIEGVTSLTFAAGAVGLIAVLSGVGQLGGVMRFVSALAEGDPLWVRLRSTVR